MENTNRLWRAPGFRRNSLLTSVQLLWEAEEGEYVLISPALFLGSASLSALSTSLLSDAGRQAYGVYFSDWHLSGFPHSSRESSPAKSVCKGLDVAMALWSGSKLFLIFPWQMLVEDNLPPAYKIRVSWRETQIQRTAWPCVCPFASHSCGEVQRCHPEAVAAPCADPGGSRGAEQSRSQVTDCQEILAKGLWTATGAAAAADEDWNEEEVPSKRFAFAGGCEAEMEFGLGVVLISQGVLLTTRRHKMDVFWDENWKNKHKNSVSFKIKLCFIPFIFLSFYLLPPSLFSSLPPPLWSGGKGIFITLIRSPVLGWPFEVWFPAPSVQERILGTAGFLLLFLCIYKFALLSFLFFCFICLCFPSLIKPASLPLTGSPSLVDHYHSSIFLLQSLSVIVPFSLLCLILSILSSFLLSSVCWDFPPTD